MDILGTSSQSARRKSLKGKRTRSRSAQERPTDPPPGYPKEIRSRHQPAQERSVDPSFGRSGIP